MRHFKCSFRKYVLFILLIYNYHLSFSQTNKVIGGNALKDTAQLSTRDSSVFNILSPFNFSLGSNFDFVDGVDLTDLYFNIGTFSPSLFEVNFFNKQNVEVGINTGVRKSYTRSYNTFFSNSDYIFGRSSDDIFYKDSISIDRTTNLALTNTNFYFSPIFSLYENTKDRKFFSLFLSLDFDLMKQELHWEYEYDTISIFTQIITENEFKSINNIRLANTETYDQYIYSLGIGFPFFIENKSSAFLGKIGVGYTNIKRKDFYNHHRFYSTLALELLEKEFGLILRTELRYFNNDSSPYINFSIAKLFNLKKIIDYY